LGEETVQILYQYRSLIILPVIFGVFFIYPVLCCRKWPKQE